YRAGRAAAPVVSLLRDHGHSGVGNRRISDLSDRPDGRRRKRAKGFESSHAAGQRPLQALGFWGHRHSLDAAPTDAHGAFPAGGRSSTVPAYQIPNGAGVGKSRPVHALGVPGSFVWAAGVAIDLGIWPSHSAGSNCERHRAGWIGGCVPGEGESGPAYGVAICYAFLPYTRTTPPA